MTKSINDRQLKMLVEATIFVSKEPLQISRIMETVLEGYDVTRNKVKSTLKLIEHEFADKGINLIETGAGFMFQTAEEINEPLSNFWAESAPRYSRALLETLALIAYKQPITRVEIEKIRGVSVSQTIMKTLKERLWIKVVGHLEVPGRPSLYGTTNDFLAYFKIKSLSDLPEMPSISFEDLSNSPEQFSIDLNGLPTGQDVSEPDDERADDIADADIDTSQDDELDCDEYTH